jgi:hypothetical protein
MDLADNPEYIAKLADEIWQSTPRGANTLTEKLFAVLLLSVAVAIGNALVVLLKKSVPTRKSPAGDGRRKSLAQVA